MRLSIVTILALCASLSVGRAQTAREYASPAVCAECHPDKARSYAQTGMGRSFYRMTPETAADDLKRGLPFYHAASDTWFDVFSRDGKSYQRRWQIGFDKRETNVEEKQIDFVMGSGNHARTYLHLTPRGTLQQLPLGWYAEKGGSWAMNPGYDKPDYGGSTRAIHYECMFCHNAYPQIPERHQQAGAEAQYKGSLPEGIDCQRCHGPGQQHVKTARMNGAKPEQIRASVVNPARLTADREIEVCLQCHLETTSRSLPHSLQRFDRGPFSYIPGQPLADFRIAFDRSDRTGDEMEVNHAGYRLRESACFLKSAGKLRCTTCHDPHDVPRGEMATAHYNGVCRSCHAAFEKAKSQHSADADCVSCHMLKRRTDDAVRIVMTDHKIVRTGPSGDLTADKAEVHDTPTTAYRGEVVPYYPKILSPRSQDMLYSALAQIADRSNLTPGLSRMVALIDRYHPAQPEFYARLGEGYLAAGGSAKAIALIEQAAQRAPMSELIRLELGNALMQTKQWASAETAFRAAASLRPDDPSAWGLLGWVLGRQNKTAEARKDLEKALQIDPEIADFHYYLASLLITLDEPQGAERELRAAIAIDPAVAEWQSNLGLLLASKGRMDEARYCLEQSIRSDPEYLPARLNFARVLANANDFDGAAHQAKAAVAIDPNLGPAHELLGSVLSAKGDNSGAIRELNAALTINPDSGRAHYELGALLAQSGDPAGAIPHFRAAARDADPNIAAAAREMLTRLGQR